MNDALDDILAESGDEEEEESIVTQVLDEIGIEISGKVRRMCLNVVNFRVRVTLTLSDSHCMRGML